MAARIVQRWTIGRQVLVDVETGRHLAWVAQSGDKWLSGCFVDGGQNGQHDSLVEALAETERRVAAWRSTRKEAEA